MRRRNMLFFGSPGLRRQSELETLMFESLTRDSDLVSHRPRTQIHGAVREPSAHDHGAEAFEAYIDETPCIARLTVLRSG